MATSWKPGNMPAITPALPGGRKLIAFMEQAFEAKAQKIFQMENGAIARAEVRLGESLVITGDPIEGRSTPPATLHIYVPNCDVAYKRAVEAGAVSKDPPQDQFYGDRTARVVDPFGNQWSIATHTKDVTAEEMSRG